MTEYYSAQEYTQLRETFLSETMRLRPDTIPELTAYTPTETKNLLENNEIIGKYFDYLDNYEIPKVSTLIGIPCAAAKPWTNEAMNGKKSMYGALWEVKDSIENAYFVTVSEPLAIVPEDNWDLQVEGIGSVFYDVPGLFSTLPQLAKSPEQFEKKYGIEKKRIKTDRADYHTCVDILGHHIAAFLNNNGDNFEAAEFFVKKGSTHDAFLKKAKESLDDSVKDRMHIHYLPKGYIKPGLPAAEIFQKELLQCGMKEK